MLGDRGLEAKAARPVEAHARLVQEPERAPGGDQAGQRQAAALPGRQEAHRRGGMGGEVERRERCLDALLPRPRQRRGEGQALVRGESRLETVLMAQIVKPRTVLGQVRRHRLAAPEQLACRRCQEAREQAQQRGLAAAVGAAQDQRIPGLEGEADAGHHRAAAAHAGELPAGEERRLRCGGHADRRSPCHRSAGCRVPRDRPRPAGR